MHDLVSKLIYYRQPKGSILHNLSIVLKDSYSSKLSHEDAVSAIYDEVNRILQCATENGFDEDIWTSFLCYVMATDENSFTLTMERAEIAEGTSSVFAINDFEIFSKLINYNFIDIESFLNINCFTHLKKYSSLSKVHKLYNKNVSEEIARLRNLVFALNKPQDLYNIFIDFYKNKGVGIFAFNKAFRLENSRSGLVPIISTHDVSLDNLVGYESQKNELKANTTSFLEGKSANNCLLYGDSGTGKSSSIKGILNLYSNRGLRMIEVYKHQFEQLAYVISNVKNRNYKFIIYMDDLSFEDFEIEYKYLKAVIEGGLETKPANVLIYASSNRRHLIRELWKDRQDISNDELHTSDTLEEKLSLASRFGLSINFNKPDQQLYFEMVRVLAKNFLPQNSISDKDLISGARIYSLTHGGFSGRIAQQYINYLLSCNDDYSEALKL